MDHHILLNVVFILTGKRRVSVEMVVDTGYVGTLSLPPSVVQAFALPFLRNMAATLADGTSINIDVHLATTLWHGIEQTAEVVVLDDRPLVGMILLDGSNMTVNFENGGLMVLSDLG
jgi:clan AA aspartic protease